MLKLFSKIFFRQTPYSQPEGATGTVFVNGQLMNNSAFQGDLSVVTIENLMQLVSHAALSGELCLTSSGNRACFIVRDGALVFGQIDLDSPRIGERLLQAGYISAEDLQKCLLVYQEQPEDTQQRKRLGELLIEEQFILENHLEEIVKEQIKDSFFQVLGWNEGMFTFCVDESPHRENIHLDERIDHLLIEGIVALDDNSANDELDITAASTIKNF